MRIHFVINPKAGRGKVRDLVEGIRREFSGYEISIASGCGLIPERTPSGHDDIPWSLSPSRDAEMLVAVGGDGTVNGIINAANSRNLPVGIVPCGSSNDLARTLGIPADFKKACQAIKKARLTEIDLGSVNGTYFATCGGLGIASEVAASANRWRNGDDRSCWLARAMGRWVYPLAFLCQLLRGYRPLWAQILSQGRRREGHWLSILFSNQPQFGGFSASPFAHNRDGLLDLCQVAAPSRRGRMFWIGLQAFRGRVEHCPESSQHRIREVTIVTGEAVTFFGDGEILDHGRFFHLQVHPRALWVVVPEGAKTWECHRRNRESTLSLKESHLRREPCQPMNMSA